MLGIRLHGRGGQGAQVGCQILAAAFFRAGAWVQAFAAYGGERRGAPVTASLRVDDAAIHLRCDVTDAHHLLVLDPTLLAGLGPDAIETAGTVIVNSTHAPCSRMPGASRIVTVDASAIARDAGLGPIVSTAVLGAFAAATGLVTLEDLCAAVEEWSPVKKVENLAACRAGYRHAAGLATVTG
jgi:2-oxoacid:acceptor oxidoreductase gamma subunit (pyruvate/2-ketoisovalerate family)